MVVEIQVSALRLESFLKNHGRITIITTENKS